MESVWPMRWARSSAWLCTAGDQSSSPKTTQLARCRFRPAAARSDRQHKFVRPAMKRSTERSFMAGVSRPVMKAGEYALSSFLYRSIT